MEESVGTTPRRCLIFSLFILLLLLLGFHFPRARSSSPELQILSAERRIDLSSHIIRVSLTLKKKYSSLDVVGRTVVVLEKKNVVPDHNSPFQVHYKFNPIFILAGAIDTGFCVFPVLCGNHCLPSHGPCNKQILMPQWNQFTSLQHSLR